MLASLVKGLCSYPHSPGRKPYLSRVKRVTPGISLGGVRREVSNLQRYFAPCGILEIEITASLTGAPMGDSSKPAASPAPGPSSLSEAERARALERFRLLRPFLEDEVSLPEIA